MPGPKSCIPDPLDHKKALTSLPPTLAPTTWPLSLMPKARLKAWFGSVPKSCIPPDHKKAWSTKPNTAGLAISDPTTWPLLLMPKGRQSFPPSVPKSCPLDSKKQCKPSGVSLVPAIWPLSLIPAALPNPAGVVPSTSVPKSCAPDPLDHREACRFTPSGARFEPTTCPLLLSLTARPSVGLQSAVLKPTSVIVHVV